ncbi:MAG TPA: tetratricopeptide repeat protein [Casimicrobiaceae bacterium]|nr:tetratricopeptide repeat protein [Casimicrobiaceae bacterium]
MLPLRRHAILRLAGWARVFGASGTALRLLETLRAESPDDPSVLKQLAFHYADGKRWRDALALMDRVAELQPADAEVLFNRAYLRQQLNDHPGAIAAFEAALARSPDHDRALYGLALSLIALRRLDEAVAPLERNTRLQPMSPYGWYQLGRVQFDRGKPDKTEAIIAKLNTFEPKVAAQLARETGFPPPPRP